MQIAVIGAGNWGTAIANLLGEKGFLVRLWAYEKHVIEGVKTEHKNPLYLSDVRLSENVTAYPTVSDAVDGIDLVVMSTPSHFYRSVLRNFCEQIPSSVAILSATKGIENDSLLLMSGVTAEERGLKEGENFAVLSGPTFAAEVAAKKPSAAVIASEDEALAQHLRDVFHTDYFRVYTNTDIIGVQLGGSLKNIVAIAAGICAGLGLGLNAQAALTTRSIAEISRLAVKMGADLQTLSGLAGIGDLILTSTGSLSRNRTLGERLAKGETLEQIESSVNTIAEGVKTTYSAYKLSLKMGVEMPIVNELYDVLYTGKSLTDAVKNLMGRAPRSEF